MGGYCFIDLCKERKKALQALWPGNDFKEKDRVMAALNYHSNFNGSFHISYKKSF